VKITVVHGIRQYRGAPAEAVPFYEREWTSALAACPTLPPATVPFRLRVAYYSHLLIEPGAQGGRLEPDAQAMLGEFLAESTGPVDDDGAQGPLTLGPRAAGAWAAEAWHRTGLNVPRFLTRFFAEVAAFLRIGEGFTPKADIIASVAADMDGADIVIAHSLGSVVAYETLWATGIEVPTLVTVGSPLAVPQIFDRLTPAPVASRGAKPPGVGRWCNIADIGDIVAIPIGGIARHFDGLDRDRHDTIGLDPHKLASYLSCKELGDALQRRS
jgi:hypothetical protein